MRAEAGLRREAHRAGTETPWQLRHRYEAATRLLDPPFGIIDADALEANGAALVGLAAGKPIRVATKSVRCRDVLRAVLRQPGWRGLMCYSLPEALWLHDAGVSEDILLGYPVVNRAALATLVSREEAAAAITLMVDSTEHLDVVDAVAPPGTRPVVRVCIDLDASWRPLGVHIGVRRSPVHSAFAVGQLAAAIAARPGFELVGLMSYEAQVAGLGDQPPGRPGYAAAVRAMQWQSMRELRRRRAAAVAAAREHADLRFVNGGGTGSLAATAADVAVTELTAGSGLYGPALFDEYRAWRPTPAAYFAASVVRRPAPGLVTVHGAGWIASGPAERSRLPRPVLPPGLSLLPTEGAGEVQTPLAGPATTQLRIGDRVWFRHAKAGELCEHLDELHLIRGEQVERILPTYRGEHAPPFL